MKKILTLKLFKEDTAWGLSGILSLGGVRGFCPVEVDFAL